jgi:nicotinamide-nucleotide amidase
MKKSAGIISIGNELLSGHTVDTNTAYLGRELLSVDAQVTRQWTVPDELDAIAEALTLGTQSCDVILVTGGLGPTDDDVTRQALAEFLGAELELQEELLVQLRQFFDSRGYPMPQRNEIQAYLPVGCDVLPNEMGTAPGIKATCEGVPVYVLPGVPNEMKAMFETAIRPELLQLAGHKIVIRKLKCFGVGESKLVSMLGTKMRRGRNPLINCTVDFGVITLHVIGSEATLQEAQTLVEQDEASIRKKLGDLVFGESDDTFAHVIGRFLQQSQGTLAVAESCTGGLLAKLLTDVPGASSYFRQGWVTYCNESKMQQLGVSKNILDRFGAVSEPVAEAMALGALEKSGAQHAISVTGIAGPTGGTESKPVGLVFIGTASEQGCDVKKYLFTRDRASVRFRAAQSALHQFWKGLNL